MGHDSSEDFAAKRAYRDVREAEGYDARRFHSLRGRIGHYLDRRGLARAVGAISTSRSGSRRVLDVPCGTGRMTRFLLDQGCQVVGADVSHEMMNVAQRNVELSGRFGGFYQCDATQLPFADDAFDCVVSVRFMGHVPRDVRTRILREFARVGSHAVVEYSVRSRVVSLRRRLEQFLRSGLPRRWAWQAFTKGELEQEMREAGFEVLRMWPKFPLLSDSYYVVVRRFGEDCRRRGLAN